MKYLLTSLLLLLTAIQGHSDNERIFEYRGVTYVTRIPNEAPPSPAWIPESSEPPLSIAGAIKLAQAEFEKNFASFGTFKLNSIVLTKQGEGWMYYIGYLQDPSDITESRPGPYGVTLKTPLPVIYYVSMDGAVSGPRPKTE